MPVLNVVGWETGDATEITTVTGTSSVQSTVKHSGTYALRTNPTTTAVGHHTIRGINTDGTVTVFANNTVYFRFYFRVDTAPAANNEPIFQAFTATPALKFEVRITSARTLQIYDSTATQIGSDGATVLSLATWYRIEVQVGTSATVGAYEVRINGATEFGPGTTNTTATANGQCTLGKGTNRNGQTVDFYYDDFICNNSSFAQNGALDTETKCLIPTANGSTMQWTGGTGSSNFAEVDEIPPSDTEYVTSAAGAGDVALFAMQDTATVGITGTIVVVKAFIRTREDVTVTSSNKVRIRAGGSNSDNSVALNATTTVSTRGLIQIVDPSTSAAWTLPGIDGIEVGSIEGNAVAVRCTSVLCMVVYMPLSATDLVVIGEPFGASGQRQMNQLLAQ